ncbi:PrgI family protein [Streptomyces sp. NPDC002855]|uniref:PrgI family protein n=1 Tax=Streptomyces sp. NPDC002855 TaxID=3154437 RepID=UPI003333FB3D
MTQPVRIPADVEREDTVLGGLNARQLLILAVTGLLLYAAWAALRSLLPGWVFLPLILPLAGCAVLLALGRRDGVSLDRLALAAVRQRLAPRRYVQAPEGIAPPPAWLAERAHGEHNNAPDPALSTTALPLPAQHVTEMGLVDLGGEGVAAVAVCGTVNFALRTPAEQEALVTAFGRYLHSLTAPVQILIRAERLDLSVQIGELRDYAAALPHPALATAAREHADYVQQLGREVNLLRRQVLLILREPWGQGRTTAADLEGMSPFSGRALTRDSAPAPADGATGRRAAGARLMRRLDEAAELLTPLGLSVVPLDCAQATAVLGAACNPDSLVAPSASLAAADAVITADGFLSPEEAEQPQEEAW